MALPRFSTQAKGLRLTAAFRKGVGDGFSIVGGFQYQDRMPLDNHTKYTWRDKTNREYSPNYPDDLIAANIKRHQVFMAVAGVSWQPGTKYLELPDRKVSLGSKYPVFSFQLHQAFNNIFGSDISYTKWRFAVRDDINLKLQGRFYYRLAIGGFIDTGKNIQAPDYIHFNGNISTLATEYLNSFQLLPIYRFSNTSRFYSLAHIEHHFNGFLTNKIPGFRTLNIYLVAGGNGFYLKNGTGYYELFAGFENILKQIRIDVVQSWLNGKAWQSGVRIGLKLLRSGNGDNWP